MAPAGVRAGAWGGAPLSFLNVGAASHARAMTWTPVEPDWAVPSPTEIADLHWLAHLAHRELGSARAGGVAAAVAWVPGGRVAPVTARDDTPVTPALAAVEMWAAEVAGTPDLPAPPLAAMCAELGAAATSFGGIPVDYPRQQDVPLDIRELYRAAFAAVLGATEADLGFRPRRAAAARADCRGAHRERRPGG